MTIRLLMLGKNKDAYIEQAIADFAKRIGAFCQLELVYLKDERVHDDVKKILKKEAETVLKQLDPQEYLIILDENGKSPTTLELNEHFSGLKDRGVGKIAVVIGSSHGLDTELKEKADFLLSLSPLTMNHQVVRIVFLEQLYRIFTLQRGMKYHK